jgi:predicted transposase YdaD
MSSKEETLRFRVISERRNTMKETMIRNAANKDLVEMLDWITAIMFESTSEDLKAEAKEMYKLVKTELLERLG